MGAGRSRRRTQSLPAQLAIAQKLAAQDPDNADWQHDHGTSLDGTVLVLMAQGSLGEAMASCERGHRIISSLAARDPGNADWQGSLSISFERMGDVRRARGDLDGALVAYQESFPIAQKLAAQDPDNADWQPDLALNFDRIGDMQSAKGDLDGALEAYQHSHAIKKKLAAREPGNVRWQVELSEIQARLGNIRLAQGDSDRCLVAYWKTLVSREVLAFYGNLESQRQLVASHAELTTAVNLEGQAVRAAAEQYRAALEILQELQAGGRLAPVDAWMLEDLEARLAALSSAKIPTLASAPASVAI